MYMQTQSQRDGVLQQKKLALFLDIDGVLHSASKSIEFQKRNFKEAEQHRIDFVDGAQDPRNFGMLQSAPQQFLADILDRHPNVVLVISSAWRNWEGTQGRRQAVNRTQTGNCGNISDLLWLLPLLHPTLAKRIVDKTSAPDFRAPNFQHRTRLDEIRSFMHDSAIPSDWCEGWVAIDDQAQHFPSEEITPFYVQSDSTHNAPAVGSELVVLVDGEVGLTSSSAQALEAAIMQAI